MFEEYRIQTGLEIYLGFQLLATFLYNSTLYLATYIPQFYTHDPTPSVLFHNIIDLIIFLIIYFTYNSVNTTTKDNSFVL